MVCRHKQEIELSKQKLDELIRLKKEELAIMESDLKRDRAVLEVLKIYLEEYKKVTNEY